MTLAVQFQTMAAMFMMGVAAGVSLDVYERLCLGLVRRSMWTRAGADILFWILQALIVFYALLRINEGELRFYIFPGLAAGFFLYRYYGRSSFLGRLEMLCRTGNRVRRIFTAVFKVLVLRPLNFVLQLAAGSVMMGLTIIKNFLFFILHLLLVPLTGTTRLFRRVVEKVLPAPVLAFIRKTTDVITHRKKD
ncbi:spore cortex biosynthesis protein YabQ [Salibacterium sp. K-3]